MLLTEQAHEVYAVSNAGSHNGTPVKRDLRSRRRGAATRPQARADERLRRENVAVLTWECECGNPKRVGAEACERCEYLDGRGRDGAVIAALREIGGPASIEEITEVAACSARSAWRGIRDLERVGRVVRAHVDVDDVADGPFGKVATLWQLID